MMVHSVIETPRLILKPLTGEDYEELLRSGTNEEIMMNFGISKAEVEKERSKAEKGFSTFNKSLLVFQLIEKSSNAIIGWCGYHTWYRDHDRAEIGYKLFRDESKNKGFMKEALGAILNYGFSEMKLQRVEALISLENIPSLKLLQHFGFIQEGVLRNHYLINGVYEDSVIFSLLKDEIKTHH